MTCKNILSGALGLLLVVSIGVEFLYSAEGDSETGLPEPTRKRREAIEANVLRSGGGSALSNHKLNYVAVGGDDLKLQYSFKYRFVEDFNLYAAFTNYMLWEIYKDSIPVKDNNFNPEFFYRFVRENKLFTSADLGYVHLSNGGDGPTSRSLDRLFVRFQKAIRIHKRSLFASSNIYFKTLGRGRHNQDIDSFVGWWDLTVWFRNVLAQRSGDGLDLQFILAAGKHGHPFDKGSVTLGFQYRIQRWLKLNPTLYIHPLQIPLRSTLSLGFGNNILLTNQLFFALSVGAAWTKEIYDDSSISRSESGEGFAKGEYTMWDSTSAISE